MATPEHPRKLERDTIVDCIIEVRFQPSPDSAREVLQGVLFGALRSAYPKTRKTAISEIPPLVREKDPNLRYIPTVEFLGDFGSVKVGNFVVQITVNYPYPGWEIVRPQALKVLEGLMGTGLIESFERISVLYHNIMFTAADGADISPFELDLRIGRGLERASAGTSLRTEFPHDLGVSIVQIQTGAEAKIQKPGEAEVVLKGPHLSIDTIANGDIKTIEEMMERLEYVRDVERDIYFRMLKQETWAKLGPIWE